MKGDLPGIISGKIATSARPAEPPTEHHPTPYPRTPPCLLTSLSHCQIQLWEPGIPLAHIQLRSAHIPSSHISAPPLSDLVRPWPKLSLGLRLKHLTVHLHIQDGLKHSMHTDKPKPLSITLNKTRHISTFPSLEPGTLLSLFHIQVILSDTQNLSIHFSPLQNYFCFGGLPISLIQ